MSRMIWLGLLVCGCAAGFVLLSTGESPAEAEARANYPALKIEMLDQIRTLSGYDQEPETFERYFRTSHDEACQTVFVENQLRPTDPGARDRYVAELYRLMVDKAFRENRTDLTDVVTRAYMQAVQQP